MLFSGFSSRLNLGLRQTKGQKADIEADIALHGNPISELRDVTCHMGSHSVTCHPTQVNAPRLIPATQAGTRFTNPGGMEG